MTTGAIIVAAGRSERMGGIDKLLAPLAGRALVSYALGVFAAHSEIDAIVVVTSETNRAAIEAVVAEAAPRARVVLGGARRRDSVLAGLEALPDCDYVVVHDAARPLAQAELIEAALTGAKEHGAALCAVPVTDTVKRTDDARLVQSTVLRQNLWLAQTPQAFRVEVLRRAHAATDIDATDDAVLVELLGEPVLVVPGSARNLKITTRDDLRLAAAIISIEEA